MTSLWTEVKLFERGCQGCRLKSESSIVSLSANKLYTGMKTFVKTFVASQSKKGVLDNKKSFMETQLPKMSIRNSHVLVEAT